jgi:hypothetical protein
VTLENLAKGVGSNGACESNKRISKLQPMKSRVREVKTLKHGLRNTQNYWLKEAG